MLSDTGKFPIRLLVHIRAELIQYLIGAVIVLIFECRARRRCCDIRHHLPPLFRQLCARPPLLFCAHLQERIAILDVHCRCTVYLPRESRLLCIRRKVGCECLLAHLIPLRHLFGGGDALEVRHIFIEIALECVLDAIIVVLAYIVIRLVDCVGRAPHKPFCILADARHKKPVLAVELLRETRHNLVAGFHHIGGVKIITTLRKHLVDLPDCRAELAVFLPAAAVGVDVRRHPHGGRMHCVRLYRRLIRREFHLLPPPAWVIVLESFPERVRKRRLCHWEIRCAKRIPRL